MSKKSATPIQILILTLMALALCGTTLFVFLTNRTAERIILNAGSIQEIYTKEEQIKFFIKQVALDVAKENFSNENEFEEKLKAKIQEYAPELEKDPVFSNLISWVKDNNLKVEFKGEKILVKILNFEIYLSKKDSLTSLEKSESLPELQIIHKTNLTIEIEKP